jgi:hypothetical protein
MQYFPFPAPGSSDSFESKAEICAGCIEWRELGGVTASNSAVCK